jgi:DNA polymerase III alpha subunit
MSNSNNFPSLLRAQYELINNKIEENGKANVLLFDTETTGLDEPIEITEFGGIVAEITKDEEGNFVLSQVKDIEKKYYPNKPIGGFASGLTRLVRDEESSKKQVIESYGEYIAQRINRNIAAYKDLNQSNKADFVKQIYAFAPEFKESHPELGKKTFKQVKEFFENEVYESQKPTILTKADYPVFESSEMDGFMNDNEIDICVAHNSNYDFGVLKNTYGYKYNPIIEYDTMSYGLYGDKDDLPGSYRSIRGKNLNAMVDKLSPKKEGQKEELEAIVSKRESVHEALLDVQAMSYLFEDQLNKMQKGYEKQKDNEVSEEVERIRKEITITEGQPFGRYHLDMNKVSAEEQLYYELFVENKKVISKDQASEIMDIAFTLVESGMNHPEAAEEALLTYYSDRQPAAEKVSEIRGYKEGDVLVASSHMSHENQLKYSDLIDFAQENKLSGVFLTENIPTDLPTVLKEFKEAGVPLIMGLTITAKDTGEQVDILLDSTDSIRRATPITRGMSVNSLSDLDKMEIKYQAHNGGSPAYVDNSQKEAFFIGTQIKGNTKTTKAEIEYFKLTAPDNSLNSGLFEINLSDQEELKKVIDSGNNPDLFWQKEIMVSAFPSWRVLSTFADNDFKESKDILETMSEYIARGDMDYQDEKENDYELAEEMMKERVFSIIESEEFKEEQYQKYVNQRVTLDLDELYGFTKETPESEKKEIISSIDIKRANEEFVDIGAMNDVDYLKYFLYKEGLIKVSPVVGPGRGSAAGSIIAMSLGITKLHPVQNRLLFSRFVNKFRKEMPDIDTDFGNNTLAMKQMAIVFTELQKAYYSKTEHMSPTLKSMNLTEEQEKIVLDALGDEPVYTSRLSNIVSSSDRTVLLALCRTLSAPHFILQSITNEYDESKSLEENISQMSTAKDLQRYVYDNLELLEGLRLNSGIHAGAFIASNENIGYSSFLTEEGVLYCTKKYSEDFYLIKMDILGNLSIEILDAVSKVVGKDYVSEPYSVADFKDGKVFHDIGENLNTVSTAQSGTNAAKKLLSSLYPLTQDILTAMVALNRPGPKMIGADVEYTMNLQSGRAKTLGLPTFSSPEAFDKHYKNEKVLKASIIQMKKVFGEEFGEEQCTLKSLKNILVSEPYFKSEAFSNPLRKYYSSNQRGSLSEKDNKESYNIIIERLRLEGRSSPEEFVKEIASLSNSLKGNDIFATITEATSGVIIYQEQIQKLAENLARMTEREGNALRSAVAKKKDIESHKGRFLEAILSDQIVLEFNGSEIYQINGNTICIEYKSGKKKTFEGVISEKEGITQIVEYEDAGMKSEFSESIQSSVKEINRLLENGEMEANEKPSEITKEEAQFLWDSIEEFGEYAFNLSHAAAYAQNTYTTQQIKVEHPTEAYTEYLNNVKDLFRVTLIEEIKGAGIRTELQHLNNLSLDNVVKSSKDKVIGVSLTNVKGIGEKEIAPLKRVMSKSPNNIYELMVEYQSLPKKVIEKLGALGLFDELGDNFLPFGSANIVSEDFPKLFDTLAGSLSGKMKTQIKGLYDSVEVETRSEGIVKFLHINPAAMSKVDYFYELSASINSEGEEDEELSSIERGEALSDSKETVYKALVKTDFTEEEIELFLKEIVSEPAKFQKPEFLNTKEIRQKKRDIAGEIQVSFEKKLGSLDIDFKKESLSKLDQSMIQSSLLDISAGLIDSPPIDKDKLKTIDLSKLELEDDQRQIGKSNSKTVILAGHPPKNNFLLDESRRPLHDKVANPKYDENSQKSYKYFNDKDLIAYAEKTAPIIYTEPMTAHMTKVFKGLVDLSLGSREEIKSQIVFDINEIEELDYIKKSEAKKSQFVETMVYYYEKFSNNYELSDDEVINNYKKHKRELVTSVLDSGIQHIVLGLNQYQLKEFTPLLTKKKNYLDSLKGQTVIEKSKDGEPLILSIPEKVNGNMVAPFHYTFGAVADTNKASVESYQDSVNCHQPPVKSKMSKKRVSGTTKMMF